MTVYFEDESGHHFDFSVHRQLDKLVDYVVKRVSCPFETEVSVTLVQKKAIHRLNKKFRDVDRPTDVLSFPMMEYDEPADFTSPLFRQSLTLSPETGELVLGDIVICPAVVCEQAKEYGHSELREFSFLAVHGLLHLFGYDHMEEAERVQMEDMQKEIMKELQIHR